MRFTSDMIELTRLNGHTILLNCELIRSAEASPDTLLSLVGGEKLVVRETPEEVRERMFAYRTELLRTAWPTALHALSIQPALIKRAAAVEDETR